MAIKSESYKKACEFRKKYPLTIGWRLKQHCKIIDRYVDGDEKVEYVFYGQKNEGSFDFANTYVIALTNKRIVLGTKRVLFGRFFKSVMPDMYNDSTVHSGLIWGRIIIDTVKEKILLTNIDPNALSEIEDHITEGMAKMKCQSAIDCKNQSEGRC